MASSGGSFYFPTQLRTPSFSDLLSDNEGSASVDQNTAETPELKSYSPPVSPSSYFSFLDSPAFMSNSNVIPSPSNEVLTNLTFKEQDMINYSDFSLQPPKRHAISSLEESVQRQQEGWVFNEATNPNELPLPRITVKSESTPIRTFSQEFPTTQTNHYSQPSQYIREQKRSNDGYNWRKYGQKQVKGSENPRSYYKCSYPNCPTKKKVETNLDGHITEIVYKGGHNHPKPQSTRKSSANNSEISNQSIPLLENARIKAVATPDNSSVSFGEEDFDQASSIRKSGDDHENEPEAKRWKVDDENEAISGPGSKTVRESRIVVQTTSDIDILDDGYRWRKYGQKVVKGNPNPRSYYKCTSGGCPVRKHVERASNDMRAVITTYEGKHNHDIPASRGSGNYPVNRPLSNNGIAIIRPAAIPAQSNQITNYSNTFNNTRIPTTKTQPLFELEMLQRVGLSMDRVWTRTRSGPDLN